MQMAADQLDPLLAGVAGTRVPWENVPAGVRASVEHHVRARVEAAQSQSHGFSPALAARLRLADGRRIFVKAMGPDDETGAPGGQSSYRREAEISSRLPPCAPFPAFLASWQAEKWEVLLFEDVGGANPALPWRKDQLDRVLAALPAMASALTPSPFAAPAACTPGGSNHWPALSEDPAGLEWLMQWVPWLGDQVQLLAELEAASDQACAGDTLLHFDLRADNVLLSGTEVYVVDWPHARVGAPWVDLLYFLPSVAMQGGPPPQHLFWAHPLSSAAPREGVLRVLAGFAGFMLEGATQPAPPGIPGLRRFQLAQGVASARWIQQFLTAQD
jgi:hypothetical protein